MFLLCSSQRRWFPSPARLVNAVARSMAPIRASSSTNLFAREAKITGLLPTGKFSRHLLPEFQNTGFPLRVGPRRQGVRWRSVAAVSNGWILPGYGSRVGKHRIRAEATAHVGNWQSGSPIANSGHVWCRPANILWTIWRPRRGIVVGPLGGG